MAKSIKAVIMFILLTISVSCQTKCDKSLQGTIPYQIFHINHNQTLYFYLYDKYGERNELILTDGNRKYCTYVFCDPNIPCVSKVSEDTIFLDYYTFKLNGLQDTIFNKSPLNKECQLLGNYIIIYRFFCILESESLYPVKECNSKEYGQYIDSISMIKDNVIQCYRSGTLITSIPQNKFFYENEKCKFCTYSIDTINNKRIWYYYIPTESLLKRCFEIMSQDVKSKTL